VIPTPSNTARRQAHPIAEFRIDLGPANKSATLSKNKVKTYIMVQQELLGSLPLTANDPPVKNPAIIALQLTSCP
jgi:hypothetical protein